MPFALRDGYQPDEVNMLTVKQVRDAIEGLPDTAVVKLDIETHFEGIAEATEALVLERFHRETNGLVIVVKDDPDFEEEDDEEFDEDDFDDLDDEDDDLLFDEGYDEDLDEDEEGDEIISSGPVS